MTSKASDFPQNAKQWISRWRSKPLAMLQQTRERLDQLRDSAGDPSPADLAKIVQSDPFLSYLLLKAVNNRQRGQFSSEVIGIENALKLVGVQRFLEQFGHLPLIEERFAPNSAEYACLLQQIMIARQAAVFAWDWAVARLDLKPEEIYSAALLHNQAWCQLALHEPHLLAAWLPWHASPLQNDPNVQQSVLNAPLMQIQELLMQGDNIPPSLQELIVPSASSNPRAMIVNAAASASRMSVSGWQHPQLQEQMANVAQSLRRDDDEVWLRIKRVAIDFARAWRYDTCPAPARWLPMLPGSWVPEKVEPTPNQAKTKSEIADKPTPATIFADVMVQLKAHLDGSPNYNQIMSLIIKGLHQGLQLERVVFAVINGGRQQVKARFVVGADANDPLARFEFNLQQSALLTRLMQKTAGIWLNQDNDAQFRRHLPPGWQDCVGGGEFYVMSLFAAEQPIGLILADCAGKRPLDEVGYNRFKQLCQLGAQGLARLAVKSAPTSTG